MSVSEFDIIATYFNKPGLTPSLEQTQNLPLGIGDDCALLRAPKGKVLTVSMDLLVADVHFPADADPSLIAQRALAVNLSDLAAMGAEPLAFTLGLCLPQVNENWLAGFSEGLTKSAQLYSCPLIGGDMTKGPINSGLMTIAIQVHGLVSEHAVLKRSGANPGDNIYVTGDLGSAGLALGMIQNSLGQVLITETQEALLNRSYYLPEPRLPSGLGCSALASSAIDISDGLLADLGHIAKSSGVGMNIELSKIPISQTVKELVSQNKAEQYALTAGDDYELALTIPANKQAAFDEFVKTSSIAFTYIGKVYEGEGVSCVDNEGNKVDFTTTGYKHF